MSGVERRSSAELNRTPLSVEEEARARRYAGERPDVEPTMNRLIATLDAERRLRAELLEALAGIVEIGKRDMSNPKYDGYFETAREAIRKARGP